MNVIIFVMFCPTYQLTKCTCINSAASTLEKWLYTLVHFTKEAPANLCQHTLTFSKINGAEKVMLLILLECTGLATCAQLDKKLLCLEERAVIIYE
jgi:hypothetical protein